MLKSSQPLLLMHQQFFWWRNMLLLLASCGLSGDWQMHKSDAILCSASSSLHSNPPIVHWHIILIWSLSPQSSVQKEFASSHPKNPMRRNSTAQTTQKKLLEGLTNSHPWISLYQNLWFCCVLLSLGPSRSKPIRRRSHPRLVPLALVPLTGHSDIKAYYIYVCIYAHGMGTIVQEHSFTNHWISFLAWLNASLGQFLEDSTHLIALNNVISPQCRLCQIRKLMETSLKFELASTWEGIKRKPRPANNCRNKRTAVSRSRSNKRHFGGYQALKNPKGARRDGFHMFSGSPSLNLATSPSAFIQPPIRPPIHPTSHLLTSIYPHLVSISISLCLYLFSISVSLSLHPLLIHPSILPSVRPRSSRHPSIHIYLSSFDI